jgi:glycerol uptake facilitator-like aquaporin
VAGARLHGDTPPPLVQRLVAEWLGTATLLAVVVGSGIMGDRLSGGNVAVALLANSVATGAALVVLITIFGPVSGAHFNPVVSLVVRLQGGMAGRDLWAYVAAQVGGAAAGVLVAHAMFDLPLVSLSRHAREGLAQGWSEVVATFGLLVTVLGASRHAPERTPMLVGLYILAAYWFTASTSFANPAVTVARALTDTFAGIRPVDVPAFVVAQTVGAAIALFVWRFIDRPSLVRS